MKRPADCVFRGADDKAGKLLQRRNEAPQGFVSSLPFRLGHLSFTPSLA